MRSLENTWAGKALDATRLQISGWTDISFTASTVGQNQLPMGFNYAANQFLLQQNWVRFERTVDTSGSEREFGFRSDTILPGSDYRFTVARGLMSYQLNANNGQPNPYGIDPIQFYAEAYFPNVAQGLDVKLGRIFCQFGVEANDAPSNALLSHSYTFIYNPFTHTGIMGTLKLTDAWSVQAGMMLGNDVFIDPASSPYGMGSVKWAPPDGKNSILFNIIVGSGQFNVAQNFHNPEIFDLVCKHEFSKEFRYAFESLYGFTTNVPGIGFANWFGIINYFTCDITPRVSATTRLEFFDDLQGQRTGFSGLYTAMTAGISYKPRPGIIIRPELRYDVNANSLPFQGRPGVVTAATDCILRW